MWPFIFVVLTCLAIYPTRAQSFDSDGGDAYDTDLFGMNNNDYYSGLYGLNSLERRIQALEYNVRTGAFGGCESGVIGPFSPGQRVGNIKFRTQFPVPPAVSLAVSDLQVANAYSGLNFQIRPSAVTTTSATVNVVDKGNNLTTAYVSYMACPNNANKPVRV